MVDEDVKFDDDLEDDDLTDECLSDDDDNDLTYFYFTLCETVV